MNTNDAPKTKRMHFALVLLISFILYNSGFILDQTVQWTDHYNGFINGIFHILVYSIVWCVEILPWSVLIYVLYRWKKWERFRTYWILAPAILILIGISASLILSPSTPAKRFKSFAKADLPTNATGLKFNFRGGGLADYGDTYYFKTSPNEVERLIMQMHLQKEEDFIADSSYTPIGTLPNCPDFKTWTNAKQYRNHAGVWFYYLIVNGSKTEVYILIGCI